MSGDAARQAAELLRAIAGPGAEFRSGQLEAILALVDDRARVLLVQRTGWGKSAVYFIATRLLRERGTGPTLLVSPLLALMRNQIDMAAKAGVVAVSINSANRETWPAVREHLDRDEADLLLVSPERLNNPEFRQDVMPSVAARSGLLVIDEVHCISDWGHDFRPDYRRLARLLDLMPGAVPVLGTTATANDRVVADIVEQLGTSLQVHRGTLERESLRLFAHALPDQAARMAWLATYLPRLSGSGIVYCLTIADTRRVADWLVRRGIDAVAYSGAEEGAAREETEQRLLDNDVKAVVATSALGMGFDKPDLGFVVHYQAPGSVIAYYQQVGRAGRALDEAFGVLLTGVEDTDIQDYFIETAFPPQQQAEAVVELLEEAATPLSLGAIEARVNVKHSRLEAMLKVLEVEGAVERGGGWRRTLQPWRYDAERVDRVTAQRRAEQQAMRGYVTQTGCLMAFLRRQLDDPAPERCGRCGPCTGQRLPLELDPELVAAARAFLRSASQTIEPRRQWPAGLGDVRGRIPPELRAEPGRVLSVFGDAGYGQLVRAGKLETGTFDEELVTAAASLIRRQWRPDPAPAWVTAVPSLRRPGLVGDFAARLAAALDLPYRAFVDKTRETSPQKTMENSAQHVRNVLGAFALNGRPDSTPVLLVDDVVDSRWTLTVVAAVLRESGSGPVLPFALADAGSR